MPSSWFLFRAFQYGFHLTKINCPSEISPTNTAGIVFLCPPRALTKLFPDGATAWGEGGPMLSPTVSSPLLLFAGAPSVVSRRRNRPPRYRRERSANAMSQWYGLEPLSACDRPGIEFRSPLKPKLLLLGQEPSPRSTSEPHANNAFVANSVWGKKGRNRKVCGGCGLGKWDLRGRETKSEKKERAFFVVWPQQRL